MFTPADPENPFEPKAQNFLRLTPLAIPLTAALGVNALGSLTNREFVANFANLPVAKTTVGPLVISVQSDPSRGQALVLLQLSGTTLLTQLLCLVDPVLQFDLAQGDSIARGRITLKLLEPPRYSSVDAEVTTWQGEATKPFKGMLSSWVATALPVIGDFVAILTSELSTLTTVRGQAANFAEFQFFQGETPIAQAEVTQFAQVQVFPAAIVSGGIRIESGAQITLSIPSSITPGWLFLQATFSSPSTPQTRISSSVANWSLPTLSLITQPQVKPMQKGFAR